jgi:hypothetical protein
MKTLDVKLLVNEVLPQLPKPYTEHVIDDVFFAIESKVEWRRLYESLCESLTKPVVNNWGGRWVGIALGKVGVKQVPSRRSSLIESYSLLDTDASTISETPLNPASAEKFMASLIEVKSDCQTCLNLSKVFHNRCVAYPDGIPQKILLGKVKHRTPYKGDGGILYKPIKI